MDFRKFQQPDNYYRPAPFWAINDRLHPDETARQMGELLEVGYSGGFFHSRAGMITEYIGDDWFANMDAALAVAKERDGYLWLYDEDLWPSGNAGGQVAGMKDEYRAAGIYSELFFPGETPTLAPESTVKAAYLLTRDGVELKQVEQVSFEEACTRTDAERLIITHRYAEKIAWWGGESYANLLHPEAIQQFIKLTHEAYFAKYGEEFGKRVPGIFTDEPQCHQNTWPGDPTMLPWYEGFPKLYRQWYGRDLWADLPYLYFNGPESRKIRLLLHRMVLRQFVDAYSKPIFEWCEAHGLAHTGHYMNEDHFMAQIRAHCGGIMAHYRYQHIPGIDHLCRQTEGQVMITKQVSSAARQLGRKQVLTELFGVSRHTTTFEDFKWLGDINLVLGANFFCPHLSLYSARGRRKRDYPPNLNYQQTYWKELRPLNDYFTRLGYVLTRGEAKADILLLHSIENGTAGHRLGVKSTRTLPGEDFAPAWHYDGQLTRALESILTAGYECDLGDEGYLEDLGAVVGDKMRIGEMLYSVVVVPPSVTWRPNTLAMLHQFVANGGKLVILGELPYEADCEPAPDEWQALAVQAQIIPCARPQIQAALDQLAPRSFTLRDLDGQAAVRTYLQHRIDGDQQLFFIVNQDRNHSQPYQFTLHGASEQPLAIWNPLDGTRTIADARQVGDDLRFQFLLPPSGSILLVTGPGATEDAVPARPIPNLAAGKVTPLPNTWAFTRSEENVLVMDRLSVSLDGGQSWWDEDLDFRVRRRLAEHFGTSDALAWQPWVAIRKGLYDGKGGDVVLRYRFHSALAHPQSAYLVVEDLTKGSVTINGTPVDLAGASWQWDHGFGKVDITPQVQQGENIVDFRVHYDFLTEVEPAYIVGDFGVRLRTPSEGEIIDEPTNLSNGSWRTQGYPFYSGRMIYRTTIQGDAGKHTFLHLNQASGILYKVRVNGEEAGSILWRPHLLEITDHVQPGENLLEIEVVSSRQNTLGPLHEKEGDDIPSDPGSFESESIIRPEFSLYDYGLLGGAELIQL